MLHARSPFVTCVVSLILFTISTPTAFGQSESGGATMVGIVRDQTSAVVPGVTVTVRHLATQAARSAVTDVGGRFALPALPVGAYAVEAALQGFQTVRIERVELAVG